jgi:hypothetical protein
VLNNNVLTILSNGGTVFSLAGGIEYNILKITIIKPTKKTVVLINHSKNRPMTYNKKVKKYISLSEIYLNIKIVGFLENMSNFLS